MRRIPGGTIPSVGLFSGGLVSASFSPVLSGLFTLRSFVTEADVPLQNAAVSLKTSDRVKTRPSKMKTTKMKHGERRTRKFLINPEDWRVTAAQLAEAQRIAFADYGTDDPGILFLLAKGVKRQESNGPCLDRFALLLNPPDENFMLKRQRLDRLVTPQADKSSDTTTLPPGLQTFDQFLARCRVWNNTYHAYVTLRERGKPFVHRYQPFGLSYSHAAVVAQHYYYSRQYRCPPGMIDMTKLIRQSFSSDDIEHHIFGNGYGSSTRLLDGIVERHATQSSRNMRVHDFRNLLTWHGPALVSDFKVHADFYASKAIRFDGSPKGPFIGHHAMVLIGIRKVISTGKQWYLLQNWWKDMQFVEVSQEYMDHCGARLTFVAGTLPEYPDWFPSHSHRVAEYMDTPEDPASPYPLHPPNGCR